MPGLSIVTRTIFALFLSAFLISDTAGEGPQLPATAIKSVLTSYGSTIGCVLHLEDENILRHDIDGDGKKEFIVLFRIDPGCSGGMAMHQSAFAVLEQVTGRQIFVRPTQSFPAARPEGFIQNIDRIFVEDDQLWYEGKEFDWTNDARCCPSVPVKARIFFKDGTWVDSRQP